MTKTCLAYLSLMIFGQGPCTDHKTFRLRLQEYPFLVCAAVKWGNHARGPSEHPCKEDILRYLSDEHLVTSAHQAAAALRRVRLGQPGSTFWSRAYRDDLSMLSTAASLGLISIVYHLIQCGHDIESADRIGTTALTRAAQDGHTDTVRILLAAGAETHRVDVDGITALILTAANGYEDIVAVLLLKNLNIETRTLHGKTAQYCAVFSGHKFRMELLLRNGANIETEHHIFRAAMLSHNAAMISYFNAMTDKDTKTEDVRSSLAAHMARRIAAIRSNHQYTTRSRG